MIELNTDITDDFVDDNWRQLKGKVEQETKAIINSEFDKLKQEMNDIFEQYQNGIYDEALQSQLTHMENDTKASMKAFSEKNAEMQQAIKSLSASLEDINSEELQVSLAKLQSASESTQQRLLDVREKVLSFSNTAGKTIASTIMKSVTGGLA